MMHVQILGEKELVRRHQICSKSVLFISGKIKDILNRFGAAADSVTDTNFGASLNSDTMWKCLEQP